MEYSIIKRDDVRFQKICEVCEREIVQENLRKNGGTLNFSGLTHDSQILILGSDNELPIAFCSLVVSDIVGMYVYQIAVKKEHQRKGIGKEMINITKDLAHSLNLNVSAHVRTYNENSINLFEKSGFVKDDKNSNDDEIYYWYNGYIKKHNTEKSKD